MWGRIDGSTHADAHVRAAAHADCFRGDLCHRCHNTRRYTNRGTDDDHANRGAYGNAYEYKCAHSGADKHTDLDRSSDGYAAACRIANADTHPWTGRYPHAGTARGMPTSWRATACHFAHRTGRGHH